MKDWFDLLFLEMFSDLHCDLQTKSPNKDITITSKIKNPIVYHLRGDSLWRFFFFCGRIFGTVLALHMLQLVAGSPIWCPQILN